MQTQDALVFTSRCIWSANVDGQVHICAGDVHMFLYVHLYVYARIKTYLHLDLHLYKQQPRYVSNLHIYITITMYSTL